MSSGAFKNDYVSYSRLRRFADCPKSFELHYVRAEPAEPTDALRFGALVHETLEQYFAEKKSAGFTGEIDANELGAVFTARWPSSGLSDLAHFRDGITILEDYAHRHRHFDHAQVLGIEQEFAIPLGRFTLKGFIDRIERRGDAGIEVIDFKTNRLAFTRDEVENDVQLSVYATAVKSLYPDATDIVLSLELLRHGVTMSTRRADPDLAIVRAYLEVLAEETERTASFPAKLNRNCVYCDHRGQCGAYLAALETKPESVFGNHPTIEVKAQEFERLSRLAKMAYAKKAQLEEELRAHIESTGNVIVGDLRFGVGFTAKPYYPMDETIAVLSEVTGIDPQKLAKSVLVVDNERLHALVRELRANPTERDRNAIESKLAAIAEARLTSKLEVVRVPSKRGLASPLA